MSEKTVDFMISSPPSITMASFSRVVLMNFIPSMEMTDWDLERISSS
jgi:hypothetical protein